MNKIWTTSHPTPWQYAGHHKFKFIATGEKTYHGKLTQAGGATKITKRWFMRATDAESYARRIADRSARLCAAWRTDE